MVRRVRCSRMKWAVAVMVFLFVIVIPLGRRLGDKLWLRWFGERLKSKLDTKRIIRSPALSSALYAPRSAPLACQLHRWLCVSAASCTCLVQCLRHQERMIMHRHQQSGDVSSSQQ